jgi:hypothetical protein
MRRFAEAILAGNNPSQAYRMAYRAKTMRPSVIATEANTLLRRPDIATMLSTRRAAVASVFAGTQAELVREYAIAAFAEVADSPSWPDKQRALDSIARILGYDKPEPRPEQHVAITRVTVVLPPDARAPDSSPALVVTGESERTGAVVDVMTDSGAVVTTEFGG